MSEVIFRRSNVTTLLNGLSARVSDVFTDMSARLSVIEQQYISKYMVLVHYRDDNLKCPTHRIAMFDNLEDATAFANTVDGSFTTDPREVLIEVKHSD